MFGWKATAGTMTWTWGWCWTWRPQVCRTLVNPPLAPPCLGGDDVLEGGGAFAQHEVVEDLGMEQAEGAQLRGKGEGDHEVGHGQEPGFLFGGPDLLVERAALRAGPVVAAVVGVVLAAGSRRSGRARPPRAGVRHARTRRTAR